MNRPICRRFSDRAPRTRRLARRTCVLLAGIALAATAASLAQASPPEAKAVVQASVEGKYENLLAVVRVPDDRATYGEFYDYGMYEGDSWAGFTGLPPGNWVYVYPHWYIWERTASVENSLPLGKASVDGKYSKLLIVIHVPDDLASYGEFYDYGAYSGTTYVGYSGLPVGHWVYVAPYWYIWERSKSDDSPILGGDDDQRRTGDHYERAGQSAAHVRLAE